MSSERFCADDAPQVSNEQLRDDATFLAKLADLMDPSQTSQELRFIAVHLRVRVGDIA